MLPLSTGLNASASPRPPRSDGAKPLLAVSFGGHSQRYPLANSVEYEQAIVHYPGWGATQKATSVALKDRGMDSRLLSLDPGHGWAIGQFSKQPEANPRNRYLIETDALYRERDKRYLNLNRLDKAVTVLPSLNDIEHPTMDVVSGLNVLTQRNPLQRQEMLVALSTKVLAPKGELILTETVLDFPLLGWGARGRALFKHSANVLAASMQQGQWGNVWLEAHHLMGALKGKEWFPLRDSDLRRIAAQQGLDVSASEQVFPLPKTWVPFRQDKQGVFVYHLNHRSSPPAEEPTQ